MWNLFLVLVTEYRILIFIHNVLFIKTIPWIIKKYLYSILYINTLDIFHYHIKKTICFVFTFMLKEQELVFRKYYKSILINSVDIHLIHINLQW